MTNAKHSQENNCETRAAKLGIQSVNNFKETHIHVHFGLCYVIARARVILRISTCQKKRSVNIYFRYRLQFGLCGLEIRVPGYTTEMCCISCEVRTEFIYIVVRFPGFTLCFLWGTNWIYVCYIEGSRQSLWSSGQSFWLQDGDVLCFLWGKN
jgi:hypothetical protein